MKFGLMNGGRMLPTQDHSSYIDVLDLRTKPWATKISY